MTVGLPLTRGRRARASYKKHGPRYYDKTFVLVDTPTLCALWCVEVN